MSRQYDTITLLSDRGRVDETVGVLHSIIRDVAGEARVIDLSHDVAPHDVRSGALMLARSVSYIAPGVVVASVDPDGSAGRRSIAVEVGAGVGVLMGPDNGLLANAVAIVGGAGRCVELDRPDIALSSPGASCALRDVLVPAAAHLATGVDLYDLGSPIEPTSLLPALIAVPRLEHQQVIAEVMWVDRFGKVQLNVDLETIAHLGATIVASFGATHRTVAVATDITEVLDGHIGLVTDTHGLMSFASPRRSAAAELGITVGAEIVLAPALSQDTA